MRLRLCCCCCSSCCSCSSCRCCECRLAAAIEVANVITIALAAAADAVPLDRTLGPNIPQPAVQVCIMVGPAIRIRPGSGPSCSGLGPQRGGFRSNRLKKVNTTFSLLVGNGRGFAQGILPLFILSASSLNKLSHLLHVLLGSSAVNDCRQRHRYYGAFTNSVGREDVIPTAVVCPKGSHMLAVHPFMTDFFTSSIILIPQHSRSRLRGSAELCRWILTCAQHPCGACLTETFA